MIDFSVIGPSLRPVSVRKLISSPQKEADLSAVLSLPSQFAVVILPWYGV